MSKDVQMTFRVELELRAEFNAATLQEHRPAAQVLREFMRTYVNDVRERHRRESAVNFSRASIGLEGLKPSKEAEDEARRFINGEIQLTELVRVKE